MSDREFKFPFTSAFYNGDRRFLSITPHLYDIILHDKVMVYNKKLPFTVSPFATRKQAEEHALINLGELIILMDRGPIVSVSPISNPYTFLRGLLQPINALLRFTYSIQMKKDYTWFYTFHIGVQPLHIHLKF